MAMLASSKTFQITHKLKLFHEMNRIFLWHDGVNSNQLFFSNLNCAHELGGGQKSF
uniref:Uncharacterized protein n=1 Tax=Candidatus Nitrotoga fabula TaxID=2182327 RepID=A0A2X0QVT7_9PROT|nr:protein of unknown function [Candidatus Nitrotoga fabula]